ncbi:MAG: hypothetical protein AAGB22_02205 [Bacteroidota bacterium]
MKLRIKDQTIRLRLTQTEVDTLAQTGVVSASIALAPGDAGTLTYEVAFSSSAAAVHVQFNECIIRVEIPANQGLAWAGSDQVGVANEAVPGATHPLHILVEKDFQCLHKRPHEDESDHFPHPLMAPSDQNPSA